MDPESATSLESGSMGNWNQFEANTRLFNVKNTYDENIYTKKIDLSKVSKAQLMKAEKLAREIEGCSSTNSHLQEERGQKVEYDMDEEDLYSGVLREDSYQNNMSHSQNHKVQGPGMGQGQGQGQGFFRKGGRGMMQQQQQQQQQQQHQSVSGVHFLLCFIISSCSLSLPNQYHHYYYHGYRSFLIYLFTSSRYPLLLHTHFFF